MRRLLGLWRRSDRVSVGHRLTQPGNRRQAIAFWRRCAAAYVAQRFPEEAIEGWKPAEIVRVTDARQRKVS